jgi:hypothetical protein
VCRLSIVSLRSEASSEALTFASVAGHTKLSSLMAQPATSPDLAGQWHQDAENPITHEGVRFYRFWQVDETDIGLRVVLFVAWDREGRERAGNFGSLDELQKSRCSRISFNDVLVND